MIKITCSEQEKNNIIFALNRSTECPFVGECPVHNGENGYETCENCLADRIEWEVK